MCNERLKACRRQCFQANKLISAAAARCGGDGGVYHLSPQQYGETHGVQLDKKKKKRVTISNSDVTVCRAPASSICSPAGEAGAMCPAHAVLQSRAGGGQ